MSASSHIRPLAVAYLCLAVLLLTGAGRPARADLTPPLGVQWVRSMGPEPDNYMSPLLLGDRLFVTHDGSLYSLDPLTGAQFWKLTVKDANVSTAPIEWQGNIIIGVDNGLVLQLKPADGSQVWKIDLKEYIAPTPALIGDTLVLASEQTAMGLDPATGHTKWATSLTSGASYGPLSDGAMIYFRCQDGSVQSLQAESGKFRWRVSAPTGPESFPPVMIDRRVLLVEGKMLYAVSRTGEISWQSELPATAGGAVTVLADTIYVPCVDGHLYQVSPRSGRLQRGPTYAVDDSLTSPPLLTETMIYVGTSSSLIYALDRASGEAKWVYRCRAPEQPVDEPSVFGIYAPLVTERGNLIALSGTGDLYSFGTEAADGGGPIFSALRPEPGDALPGEETAVVSFAVFDDGCGIVPDSVSATVDGKPLTLKFNPASGVATGLLSKPQDDIHTVTATAKDYRGNAAAKQWSFLTDVSVEPKEDALSQRNRALRGGQPTGGRTTTGRGGGATGGGGGGRIR